ncbi:hypothetical protein L195_g025001 [Trifolium pratense]|uniref:Uncharacterized protein n=1 Tax=Trifolium pratense TaxID=57577 RepID=A0A2K3NF87_TRIPR|nr:hypothetical protein L195_g025001 [Trifolium pratense]
MQKFEVLHYAGGVAVSRAAWCLCKEKVFPCFNYARRDGYHARRNTLPELKLVSDLVTRGVMSSMRGVKEEVELRRVRRATTRGVIDLARGVVAILRSCVPVARFKEFSNMGANLVELELGSLLVTMRN